MKSVTVRQVREALPKLEKLLAKHSEIRVTRRGKVIARLLPAPGKPAFPSLADFRASMPFQEIPSEVLIREDRDAR
jgi:antitoxin (DNA-binding transcriptional repressor) of toxin-antitoxin stability system